MKKIKQGGIRRRLAVGVAGARGGLGLLSARATGLLLPHDQQHAHNEQALTREAHRFVKQLGQLKGAYVKIGQMLALYGEHLLPRPVTDALHTLEAQTTPLDWTAIEPVLDARFDRFDIEQKPLAAASLAQVHRASDRDDTTKSLCLKIQYPGIGGAIDDDFRNVMQMLKLTRWIESGRQLESLTNELKTHLMREVDYHYELDTAQTVASLLHDDQRFVVPNYYPQWSSKNILTMDYLDGVDVCDPSVQALSQARRNRLARMMLELFFKEAFDWRLMQTDPNFGNYRIVIDPDGENDQLALLDFGAVQHLSETFSNALRKTILAAHEFDDDTTIDGLIELNCLRQSDSVKVKQSFAQFCSYILEPFAVNSEAWPKYATGANDAYLWQHSKLLRRAGKLGSEGMLIKGFVIPPSEFMLMVRKLTGVFTFVAALDAKMNSSDLLAHYA
ncbi:ABC1 kinase family protein [Arenicella xantha]|uniref:ABC1 family protein n=1 Tax=Arenicella xantha TaxID=644221 RepID=A0A395JHS9_9GAMM|nr:AarF/ABC1/UbiB kinase family protein [Arenicella xantha]RBP49139.1 ABC1 family protein [Arenicella xantha]